MGVISYCLDGEKVGDSWKKIILIFNSNLEQISVPIPEGNYKLVAHGDNINENGLGEFISQKVDVAAISMTILVSSN
jgi:pullulanase